MYADQIGFSWEVRALLVGRKLPQAKLLDAAGIVADDVLMRIAPTPIGEDLEATGFVGG